MLHTCFSGQGWGKQNFKHLRNFSNFSNDEKVLPLSKSLDLRVWLPPSPAKVGGTNKRRATARAMREKQGRLTAILGAFFLTSLDICKKEWILKQYLTEDLLVPMNLLHFSFMATSKTWKTSPMYSSEHHEKWIKTVKKVCFPREVLFSHHFPAS